MCCCVSHSLSTHLLVDEKVGEVADLVDPDIGVEEEVGDADDPAVEPRGKTVQVLRRHQAPPDVIVSGVGQRPLLGGVVHDGERLPSGRSGVISIMFRCNAADQNFTSVLKPP